MPNNGLTDPDAEAAEAQFKRAEVTFPRGVTINASAGRRPRGVL